MRTPKVVTEKAARMSNQLNAGHAPTGVVDSNADRQFKELVEDSNMMLNSSYMTNFEEDAVSIIRKGISQVNNDLHRIQTLYASLLAKESEIVSRTSKHTSVLKDQSNKIAESMIRIDKIIGDRFEDKLLKLERFADAMTIISKLAANGDLEKIMSSLSGGK
jgi:hypothetical protein